MRTRLSILLTLAILFCGCKKEKKPIVPTEREVKKMTIKVISPAFKQGDMIPSKYTADGQNVSPPLNWEGVPDGAKSIALISDDPDAPMGTWVHWVMWNIPPDKKELPENVPPDQKLPDGSIQGITQISGTLATVDRLRQVGHIATSSRSMPWIPS